MSAHLIPPGDDFDAIPWYAYGAASVVSLPMLFLAGFSAWWALVAVAAYPVVYCAVYMGLRRMERRRWQRWVDQWCAYQTRKCADAMRPLDE